MKTIDEQFPSVAKAKDGGTKDTAGISSQHSNALKYTI
jgi:hypothetical protein